MVAVKRKYFGGSFMLPGTTWPKGLQWLSFALSVRDACTLQCVNQCLFFLRNIIHGSDSVKSAEREISLWFKPEELVDYKSCAFDWIYE